MPLADDNNDALHFPTVSGIARSAAAMPRRDRHARHAARPAPRTDRATP